jgi:hypothetical protein
VGGTGKIRPDEEEDSNTHGARPVHLIKGESQEESASSVSSISSSSSSPGSSTFSRPPSPFSPRDTTPFSEANSKFRSPGEASRHEYDSRPGAVSYERGTPVDRSRPGLHTPDGAGLPTPAWGAGSDAPATRGGDSTLGAGVPVLVGASGGAGGRERWLGQREEQGEDCKRGDGLGGALGSCVRGARNPRTRHRLATVVPYHMLKLPAPLMLTIDDSLHPRNCGTPPPPPPLSFSDRIGEETRSVPPLCCGTPHLQVNYLRLSGQLLGLTILII